MKNSENPDWEMERVQKCEVGELIKKLSYRIIDAIRIVSDSSSSREVIISCVATVVFRLQAVLLKKEIPWDEVERELERRRKDRFFMYVD